MPGKEGRRHKRHDVATERLNATLAIIEQDRTTGCLVPLKDFSKTGAGVYIKFQVDIHTPIRLSLEGLEFAPIDGKIVWCSSSADDKQAPVTHPFRLGIDFNPSDAAAQANQLAVYEHVAGLLDEIG